MRLDTLVRRSLIARRDADRFVTLDAAMRAEVEERDRSGISAFHDGREYRVLLQKVVEGLDRIGEPHAPAKRTALMEEMGTMGPAVFLTPWEMTLDYLDERIGSTDDVERFHS